MPLFFTNIQLYTSHFVQQEILDCSELHNFERYLEYWSTEAAKLFPHRPTKTLVIHCSGKSVCVTRFFRPLPLPSMDFVNIIVNHIFYSNYTLTTYYLLDFIF